jgi:Zn-finger protein
MELNLKSQDCSSESSSDYSPLVFEDSHSSCGESRESQDGCYCKECKLCKLHKNKKSAEEINRLKERILKIITDEIKDEDKLNEIIDDLNIIEEIYCGHWCDCWY